MERDDWAMAYSLTTVVVTGAGHFHAFQSSPGTAAAEATAASRARENNFMLEEGKSEEDEG